MRQWKGWRWAYPCFTVRCGDVAFQKEKGCGVLSKSVLFDISRYSKPFYIFKIIDIEELLILELFS